MANSSRESFIPRKSSAPKINRSTATKRAIGIFGYVSYITFVAAILLSGGMFFLTWQVTNTLAAQEEELAALQAEFQDEELERVQQFEQYLNTINSTFAESISIATLFTDVEQSIVDNAVITQLSFTRAETEAEEGTSNEYVLTADMLVDSFDTALFQRSLYSEYTRLEQFVVNDVVLINDGAAVQSIASDNNEGSANQFTADELNQLAATAATANTAVSFSLAVTVSPDNLPFDPQPVVADTGNGTATTGAALSDEVVEDEAVESDVTEIE